MSAPLHTQSAAGGDPFKRSMVSGTGKEGRPNRTVTYDELAELAFAKDVPCVPKDDARWLIPSARTGADARSYAAQREGGEFVALVLDIDEGGHSLAAVEAVLVAALGDRATALIYSTKSATAGDPRWRAVVPLAAPLPGADYVDTLEALCERIEEVSGGIVTLDRSMCGTGQIAYLPNFSDAPADGSAPFYEASEIGPEKRSALVLDDDHPVIRWRERRREERAATQAAAAIDRERRRLEREKNGNSSLIERFNRRHSLSELLARYGYGNRHTGEHHGWTDDWRSPYQRSGSYATRVFTDRETGEEYWVSLSGSDKAKNVGAPCASGRHGDAFDLFVHYAHSGDMNAALVAWKEECNRERRRELAEAILKARSIAAGGDGEAEPDPAAVERLAAMAAVETDDASLAAGWLADEGEGLRRLDDGSWRRFDGGHWQRLDDEGARVRLSVWLCDVADLRLMEADALLNAGEIDRKSHGKVEALRHRLRSTALLTAVFGQARSSASRARTDDFDADPMLLGVPGGRVVDLRTGEERQGRPEDHVSLSTAVAPAPPGEAPERFLAYLGEAMGGDPGKIEFLQRMFGYCLTGAVSAQLMFHFHGPGGTGKSTFLDTLKAVAGGYGFAMNEKLLLLQGKGTAAGPSPDKHALIGVRAAVSGEVPVSAVWADDTLKSLTGNGTISARALYGAPIEFRPTAKLLTQGNSTPNLPDATDSGVRRRMVLVEFGNALKGKKQGALDHWQVLVGAEGPAILRWGIDGAALWLRDGGAEEGLMIPAEFRSAVAEYFDDEDRILRFLEDRQRRADWRWPVGAEVTVGDLFPDFAEWLEKRRQRGWSQDTFSKRLKAGQSRYGLSFRKTMHGNRYRIERLLVAEEERLPSQGERLKSAVGGLLPGGGGNGEKVVPLESGRRRRRPKDSSGGGGGAA